MAECISRVKYALVAAFAGALLVVTLSAQSAQAKTLRVAFNANPANVPLMMGVEKGFFTKRGLDLEVSNHASVASLLPGLGKQYDIMSVTVSNVLLYADKGGDIIGVSNGFVDTKKDPWSSTLMVQKGITSLKQLKGKTIGTVGVGSSQLWAGPVVALKKAGLNPRKDVKFLEVPFASQLDSLRAGRIDAAVAIAPFTNLMRNAGYGPLVNPLLSVAPNVLSVVWVAKGSVAKKDKKSFLAFRAGMEESIRYVKANPAEAYRLITEKTGLPAAVARTTRLDNSTSVLKNKYITDWVKPMQSAGLLKKGSKLRKRNYVLK